MVPIYGGRVFQIAGHHTQKTCRSVWGFDCCCNQWRQRLGNFGGWIDAKGKVSWRMEVTQWGPRAKTQYVDEPPS